MPRKLFVGGLSWDTTSESLRKAFESFGPVEEAVVVTDAATGKSRGFGFVRYAEDEPAAEAMNGMNGAELDGRRLRVDFAQDNRRGPGGGGGFDRRPSGPPRGPGGGGGGGGFGPPRGPGGGGGGGGGRPGGGGGGGGDRRRRGDDFDYDDEPRGGDPRLRGTKRW